MRTLLGIQAEILELLAHRERPFSGITGGGIPIDQLQEALEDLVQMGILYRAAPNVLSAFGITEFGRRVLEEPESTRAFQDNELLVEKFVHLVRRTK